MDSPLRVLFVTTDFGHGGAERQVELLAREMARRGQRVCWASLQDAGSFDSEIDLTGLDTVGLGMRRGVPDPRGALRLAAVLRSFRPDVLHSHMVHANLLARVARLFARVPVQLSTAHNVSEGARWREIAYRLTDPLCTLTTNVSRAAVARYVRVGAAPAGKIRYLPNGLDPALFGPDPEARARMRAELGVGDAFVWLAVGRLADAKDYPTLLAAADRLRRRGRPVRVLVAGDGPERGALLAQREALGLSADEVRLLGARNDVPDLMRAADGYVMASAWEGLPMVLLEASAAGLPLVATDVGGNREVVLHGVSGLVVPPGDAAALAGAMAQVMALPAGERAAWGRAARRHVDEEYDLERVVGRWLELYHELLAQGASARRPGARTAAPSG